MSYFSHDCCSQIHYHENINIIFYLMQLAFLKFGDLTKKATLFSEEKRRLKCRKGVIQTGAQGCSSELSLAFQGHSTTAERSL